MVSPCGLCARISCAVVVPLVAQKRPVPIGQLVSGADFVTVRLRSPSTIGTSFVSFANVTVTARVSGAGRGGALSVYPIPPLPNTTSCAVTGAPSQNCAPSRSRNVQRLPPSSLVH